MPRSRSFFRSACLPAIRSSVPSARISSARGRRIYSKAITLDAEQLSATGSGSAGSDGTLDYEGIGELTGQSQQGESQSSSSNPLSSFGRALSGAVGKTFQTLGLMRIPFSVKGNTENPQFALSGVPQPVIGGRQGKSDSQDKNKKKGLFDIFKNTTVPTLGD